MLDVLGYEAWLRGAGLCDNTIDQRMKFYRARLAEWGTLDQRPAEVATWLGQYAGWTRRTYHGHLASIYRWLVETGQLQRSPLERVKQAPMPRPKPRPLTDAEVSRLMDAATGDERAWVALGLLAGLRAHEVAKIRGEDVTQRGIYVLGKGGQGAMVPTHPDLWSLAADFPRRGYWFPSPFRHREHVCVGTIEQRTRILFRSVGIAEGGIHRTRATYGTRLLRAGVNIRVVQELMRHRSLTSTEHYLGVASDELTEAIGALSAA